jgi:predicted porin
LKYTMGNLAFLFNTVKDNDKLAANADRKQTGLGVDYALSKRTTAYARYVTLDTDTNTSNAGKMTTTALGLKHSF